MPLVIASSLTRWAAPCRRRRKRAIAAAERANDAPSIGSSSARAENTATILRDRWGYGDFELVVPAS